MLEKLTLKTIWHFPKSEMDEAKLTTFCSSGAFMIMLRNLSVWICCHKGFLFKSKTKDLLLQRKG